MDLRRPSGAHLTRMFLGENIAFKNLLRQNAGHERALAVLTEVPPYFFKSVIVSLSGAEFPTA